MKPGTLGATFNGVPAFDSFAHDAMSFDDDGQSIIRVEGPKLYGALAKLPENYREVTLRLPLANRVSIPVSGVRVGRWPPSRAIGPAAGPAGRGDPPNRRVLPVSRGARSCAFLF